MRHTKSLWFRRLQLGKRRESLKTAQNAKEASLPGILQGLRKGFVELPHPELRVLGIPWGPGPTALRAYTLTSGGLQHYDVDDTDGALVRVPVSSTSTISNLQGIVRAFFCFFGICVRNRVPKQQDKIHD